METIRLQKYFTDCGVLSRRAAEAEILAGRVRLLQQRGGDVSLVEFVNGGNATGFDEHAAGWMVLKRLSERERTTA